MTEIDDAMLERAVRAHGSTNPHERTYERMRKALEAALSPKPEPEIEVTEGMRLAAMHCANNLGEMLPFNFLKYYRAMRAQEIKEAAYAAKSAPQGVNAAAPVKETGGGVGGTHGRSGDIGYTFHRRKDDPKPQQFYGMNRE